MTTIYAAFNSDGNGVFDAGWNIANGYDPTVVGQVFSNMVDSTEQPTGISLSVISPFFGTVSVANDGSSHHGWPAGAWSRAWIPERNEFDGSIKYSGFSPGQEVVFRAAGYTKSSDRNTAFIANGILEGTYNNTALDTPEPPLEWTSTADSNGEVLISTNRFVSYSYLNAMEVNYTPFASQTITNIDQLISGQTANVTLSASMNVTGVTVSDGTTTISGITPTGSGTSWSFTAPAIADLTAGLKLGNVSVTFTDGTDTTAGYSIAYQLSGYTAANITSVSDFALGVYFDPPTQVGDQFAYQADKGKVETNGEWNDGGIDPPFVGTQTLWHYSSVDQTWRDFELTTTGDGSEPEPEPPGDSIGMTRRNITRRASTSRTLTSRGMTS